MPALWVVAGFVCGVLCLLVSTWCRATPVAYMPALPQTEAAAESAPTRLVDLNTADAETLQTLPGIGPANAEAIIAYRVEHGPFAALQDVANVPGISEQMTEKWAGLAQTGTPAEKAP